MPSIQIQDVTPRDQYTATNAQTVFFYSFTLFDESDIEVYRRANATVDADDYSQKLQLNIDYTVNLTTSEVTLLSAGVTGEIITLVRNMPDERLNLYTNGTVITADALNTDQESSVLMIQQNKMYDEVLTPHYNKSEIIDDTNPQGGDVILPKLGAGQVWAKDPTNNFIEAVSIGGGGGGDVQMLNPSTTGQNQGSVARWNSVGILTDSVVNITDGGSLTGATDGTFGDIRIAVASSGTLDTVAGKDLTITAAAGKTTAIGTLGDPLTLGGLEWPAADGTAGYFIKTDGAGVLSFASGGGGAPIASTKYNLVQFADTTGGIQDSGIDYQAGVLSGMTQVNAGDLELSGNTIAAGNVNGDVVLAPNGSGAVKSNTELEVRSGNDLRLYRGTNANYVGFKAGSPTGNQIWTLPDADGAAGEVITTDGAGSLIWGTGGGAGGGGNWVQVGTTTAANSATVDLVSVFSASYTRYMIVARNVTFQTSTDNLYMRVGTGATPTWKSGGTDYAYALDGYTSAAATSVAGSTGAAQILLASSVSNSTDLPTSFVLNVFDPANAAYKTPVLADVEANSSGTTIVRQSISAAYLTAEAVSSVRFLASSGNIVTGEFEVYGFNPSGGGSGGSIPSNVVQNVITGSDGVVDVSGANPLTSTTITPSSSTSRIKVQFFGNVSATLSGLGNGPRLYRNGTQITASGLIIGGNKGTQLSGLDQTTILYVDSPATTLPVTYAIGCPAPNGTIINPPIYTYSASIMILEEIGPA